MAMVNDRIVGTRYCLEHDRNCTTFLNEYGYIYHFEVTTEETISGEQYAGYEKCYGPFTYIAPPEPLTEAEWEDIMLQEDIQWQ